MAQQFAGNGGHKGSVTISERMSKDYAIINQPLSGKHTKPQDKQSLERRKERWRFRHEAAEKRAESTASGRNAT